MSGTEKEQGSSSFAASLRASTVDVMTLHNAMGQQVRPLHSLRAQVYQRRVMLGDHRNHFTTGRSRFPGPSTVRVRLYATRQQVKLASAADGWK